MFDASLRPIFERPLHWLAGGCIAVGLTANGLTILGFVFGVFCAVFVAMGFFVAALVCLILNRLCDGLDGVVARRSGSSDFGGYLDIVFDAIWQHNLKMDAPEIIKTTLENAGLPAAEIMEGAEQDNIKKGLFATTQAAVDRGTFGAPTMFVGDEPFFGKDSLDEMINWIDAKTQ